MKLVRIRHTPGQILVNSESRCSLVDGKMPAKGDTLVLPQ